MFCVVVCIALGVVPFGGIPIHPYIVWGDRVTWKVLTEYYQSPTLKRSGSFLYINQSYCGTSSYSRGKLYPMCYLLYYSRIFHTCEQSHCFGSDSGIKITCNLPGDMVFKLLRETIIRCFSSHGTSIMVGSRLGFVPVTCMTSNLLHVTWLGTPPETLKHAL